MRTISISTDVFAEIWALREKGEDSEDEILRRVLAGLRGTASKHVRTSEIAKPDGVVDRRFGVRFPEGQEIFRHYSGREYQATATEGRWHLVGDGRYFRSLNELSRGIGAKTENAWMSWFYRTEGGEIRPVSELRDPAKITRRRVMSGNHAGKDLPRQQKSGEAMTWVEDVYSALEQYGGSGSLHHIYSAVRAARSAAGRSLPRSTEAVIRKTLEE